MKKNLLSLLLSFFSIAAIWSQQLKDVELKNKLVKEGFGCFTFYENGNYSYYWKQMSESLEFQGNYTIDSQIIYFTTIHSIKINGFENDNHSLSLGIPGKYKINYAIKKSEYKTALVNIESDHIYWSKEKVRPFENTKIDDTDCILYPYDAENTKYAVLSENLKIRKRPSLKSDVITINGYESDTGFLTLNRSIEFAGSVLRIKAKSVNEDTVDEITAPWYYVQCSSEFNDFIGLPVFGWIYGGYIKEIGKDEYEDYKRKYKPLLIKKIKEAGGTVY